MSLRRECRDVRSVCMSVRRDSRDVSKEGLHGCQ